MLSYFSRLGFHSRAKRWASEICSSGPTLQQALQDQLGLRLESKKGPVDFLVVDHAEKSPTEN